MNPEELHRLPFWIRHGSSSAQTGGKICPSGELYRIQSADPLPVALRIGSRGTAS